MAEWLNKRLERDQPEVSIHINGHYFEHISTAQGRAVLSSGPVFAAYQEQNTNPRVTTIDTITPTHAIFPLGIRSDRMHASSFANYIEGRLLPNYAPVTVSRCLRKSPNTLMTFSPRAPINAMPSR